MFLYYHSLLHSSSPQPHALSWLLCPTDSNSRAQLNVFFTIGLNHCIEQSTQKPSYYKLYHKNSTARTILTSRSLENLRRVIATLSLFCRQPRVFILPLAARPALMQRLDTVPYQVPYRLHDCCRRALPYRQFGCLELGNTMCMSLSKLNRSFIAIPWDFFSLL